MIRWLSEPRKLSREQNRVIEDVERRGGSVGVSAFSLLEIVLLAEGRKRIAAGVNELFDELETNATIRIMPFTEVGEMAVMGYSLRDPGDRVIVATARVHSMRLLTADQRIIDSNLVPVIE